MRQYLNRKTAADEFQISTKMVGIIWDEISDLKDKGKRYGASAFRGEGRMEQIRYSVMDDYMRYREWLRESSMASLVPDFDVRSAERDLGITGDPVIRTDEIAKEASVNILRMIAGAIAAQ